MKSLSEQTLSSRNYEIIVANDGGLPVISEVCNQYQLREVAIVPRAGSYNARNRAVEYSVGEYLVFVDADIIVPPGWLEEGIAELQKDDYVTGRVIIDEKKVKTMSHTYDRQTSFPVKMYLEELHFGPTANLFLKRRVLEEAGGFDERLVSGGDREFGNRVHEYTGFKLKFSDKIAVLHPPRSFMQIVKKKKRVMEGMDALYQLYPQRYQREDSDIFQLIKQTALPCKNETVIRIFGKKPPAEHIRNHLFCWLIKACIGFYQRH